MRVTIKGFRCYLERVFSLEEGSITLLKGPSGAGKTTVLQAIYWALYGQLRHVPNRSKPNGACHVQLDWDRLTIYRQKRPELLRVTLASSHPLYPGKQSGSITYEDREAQALIDRIFGDRELFRTCCYLPQGQRCPLLSGSQAERMELLNRLSFNTDDPDSYLERITKELKAIQVELERKKDQYENLHAEYTKLHSQGPEPGVTVDPAQARDPTAQTQLAERVRSLKLELEELEQQRLEHRELEGRYRTLQSQLEALPPEPLDRIDQAGIQMLRHQIQDLEKTRPILLERKRLEKQLDNLGRPESDVPDDDVTEEQVWQARQDETKYQQHRARAEKLGLAYDQLAIDQARNQLQDQQDHLNQLEGTVKLTQARKRLQERLRTTIQERTELDRSLEQLDQRLASTKEQLESFETEDRESPGQLEAEVTKQRQRLAELRLPRLLCPHCQQGVGYYQGHLTKHSLDPAEVKTIQDRVQAELVRLEQRLRDHETLERTKIQLQTQQQSLLERRDRLEALERDYQQELETSSSHETTTGPIELEQRRRKIRDFLQALHGIEVVERPPISAAQLEARLDRVRKYQTWKQLQTQLEQLEVPTELSDISILKLEDQLRELHQQLQDKTAQQQRLENLREQRNGLERQLERLEPDRQRLAEVPSRYRELHREYQETEQELRLGRWTYELVTREAELQTRYRELLEHHQDLEALQKLSQTALETSCQQLEATVNAINESLAETLTLIFEEPITVKLSLYRTLKSSRNRTKLAVNLTIYYKGLEFDSIQQLSGGEGDRISLALTLALSTMANSPCLCLDEAFTSIDGQLREACLKALRRLDLSQKMVLCVSHEDIEGHYDQTIEVST